MGKLKLFKQYIQIRQANIGKVVDFDHRTDKLYHFDFTVANKELSPGIFEDTDQFSNWVNRKLKESGSRYGVGGYMEHRTIYSRSDHFSTTDEPRRLHLGIDIWAEATTSVYVPITGTIHSFADNDNHGDYGPTIILRHDLDGLELYTLYGHLSRVDLKGLRAGEPVEKGQKIGFFGTQEENGHWPPHLHFQLMFDMEGMQGDYPGVAKFSEKGKWMANIPDPNLILRFPDL
jgi:murein DD-endopeptidase MepM/ murein hydrolase activator NlpD